MLTAGDFKRGSFRQRASLRGNLIKQAKPKTPRQPKTRERNYKGLTIIAFLNSGSGGGKAAAVKLSLEKILGKDKVFDLKECDPADVLATFATDPKVRVIACGGDGTIGWMESATDDVWEELLDVPMETTDFRSNLAIAIMPLGTGNDLSRTIGWGSRYRPYMKTDRMINLVAEAEIHRLDRWRCVIIPNETLDSEAKESLPPMLSERLRREVSVANMNLVKVDTAKGSSGSVFDGVFCNYFSIGAEAEVAQSFHSDRESNPARFSSPLKNKVIYLHKGLRTLMGQTLRGKVQLLASSAGEKLREIQIPKNCRSIVLLNIQNYAAGTKLSGPVDHGDNLIDVVLSSGLTRLGLAKLGVKTRSHLQADHVVLKSKVPLPYQVDGEPWIQAPGLTAISYQCNRPILGPPTQTQFLSCNHQAM